MDKNGLKKEILANLGIKENTELKDSFGNIRNPKAEISEYVEVFGDELLERYKNSKN